MIPENHNIPKRIGKYKVLEKLANGSMGIVYEAFDPIAERSVAIKVSISDQIQNKLQRRHYNELFLREAKTARLLHHPNILEVFDAGVDNGKHYIVMELVKHARTVKDYISEDCLLEPEQALDLIIQTAEGLHYAHQQGVIHRDIKPANLLVTEDKKIKIADFSIASMEKSGSEKTRTTGFVGSPRYMSPEQMQDHAITHQTDLYSLGVVMFELLTGKHPFEENSFSRLIYKVVNENPPDPLRIKSDLSEKLAGSMLRALLKDPAKRFESAIEMISDLKRVYPKKEPLEIEVIEEESQKSHSFSQFIERYNEIRKLKYFKNFKESELRIVNEGCLWMELNEGEKLFHQTDSTEGFYFLMQGKLSLDNVKTGDVISQAVDDYRQHQIKPVHARGKVTILYVKNELLEQLSESCQLKVFKALAVTLTTKQ